MTSAFESSTEPATPPKSDAIARREFRLFKWGTILALALGCAWPLTLNLVDPDLWGHVQYGQDWLAEGQLPRTATHTFTAEGFRWINHENIAELALAYGYENVGGPGMLVAKCLIGMAVVLSMVWIATLRGTNPYIAWVWMLVVTTNLQPFFLLRPQLLSFVYCAVTLVLLDRAFCHWQQRREVRWGLLWLLPVVVALWVNSHGGFLAGLAIIGAYLGGRILELLLSHPSAGPPRGPGMLEASVPPAEASRLALSNINRSKVALLALVGVACLAATFVNPYGLEMHRWLATSLSQPRPEITEWLAPHPGDPVFWPWLTMITIAGVSLLASTRRRDWVEIAILLLVVWQSAMHLRHVAFVALLCGYWIAPHLQSALGHLLPSGAAKGGLVALSPRMRRGAVVALLAVIALQSFAIDERLKSFPVDRGRYPVDALQFMADRQLDGRLVASFNWAQYAIAALAPDVTLAFDGRYDTCYPTEVVDMHFDFLLGEADGKRWRGPDSGPIDGTRVLKHGDPDLVLIDRLYDNPRNIMQAESEKTNPQWVLLYRDRVAELWGSSDRFNDPTSHDYLPQELRVQDPGPRDGAVPWPALPIHITGNQLASERPQTPANDAQL
ncbi:hypothetical protein [Bythopirellula goksoeyrii]|uniref:Glycosyltransferase RgtA/B/C/D-like domain-containing protein n=1 Tax=Bythopirellula goksoeyrii TaxID=1400387 RepID=A0A5B9Q6R9_9BACT|nr:hypothetical protein [Bythopirellula goksoeyrii]QEG33225.1 hypothetical protein Pr1d_04860 [Bythopirellula goksoeyrii]